MPTKALFSTLILASLVAPLAASAGEVGNRIHREQARINQGARSGSLTAGEYAHLDRRLDRIGAQRARDLRRHDGRLTAAEAARLNREESRLSGAIYHEKHDAEHR